MQGIKILWIDHNGISYVGTQEHLNDLVQEAIDNKEDAVVHLENGKIKISNGKFATIL